MKPLRLLLLFPLFIACSHPMWIVRKNPLEGRKTGTLAYKNNASYRGALKKAEDYCHPQKLWITEDAGYLNHSYPYPYFHFTCVPAAEPKPASEIAGERKM